MMFGRDEIHAPCRVFGAVLIGGMIGMERTFHGRRPDSGRSAGLRRSALLMIVTVYQGQWMHVVEIGQHRPIPPAWRKAS